jgi:hypothetical protein
MRHYRAVRWLFLFVLALSSGAFARAPAALTYRAIMTMPPSDAGVRLLGAGRGADIVKISFIDLMNAGPAARRLPGALQLFLYTRPVPLGSNFCSQRRYYLFLTAASSVATRGLRNDDPLRVNPGWDGATLARAPGCRLAAGQRFASIGDPDIAMRALDDLASVQEEARRPERTNVLQLSCDDRVEYDPDRCLGGGQAVLARLPLEQACRVDAVDGDPEVIEVTLCTGGPLWVLRLRARGRVPALSMLWINADGTY